ncbi:MAG: acyl-homoserine-lactone synthase [Gallionellaceae bacterium]|nr:acyl-homoserine-lactone synthase [Gallionellaceae bacterium]
MGQIIFAENKNNFSTRQAVMGMYRLRHKVFYERLGWKVRSIDGMEQDEFDRANPVYVLAKDDEDEVVGCWRLLPTTGPYMLKDTFPQLLQGRPAPQQADIWELSRFALDSSKVESSSFGLSETPMRMIQMAVRFAQENKIQRYVSVTSVAVDRMFRKAGIHMTRLGEPMKIGNVLTVAVTLEIDEITHFALFDSLPHVERLAA